MALIEIDNLSVTFLSKGHRVNAVKDVSLSVAAQESFGLVGESGSGKSTILRAICGLAPISGGAIRIGGQVLDRKAGKAFAVRVQMVFQDPFASLNPRLRISCIVGEAARFHGLTDAAGEDDYVAAQLQREEALEVSVYGVPAYSTLGWMNWAGGDPLLSTFIGYPEGELARMLFHELAQNVRLPEQF